MLKGKTKKVVLISVRFTKLGTLTMAKPCFRCINYMNTSSLKGYKINTIYYSDVNGDFVKCSLHELTIEEDKHIPSICKKERQRVDIPD